MKTQTQQTAAKKILIVGAGIAGLALARSLEQRGISYDIIDRTSEMSPQGYSVTIPHGGLELLNQLDVYDKVRAVATSVAGVHLHLGGHGRTRRTVDFKEDVFDVLTLRRTDLHAILLGSLTTPVKYATEITHHETHRGSAVVALSDGSCSVYDLVVGADGLHSSVRALVSPGARPKPTGVAFWTFFMPGALHEQFDSRAITQYWHAGLFAGVFPLLDSASVVLSTHVAPSLDIDSIDFTQHFARISPQLDKVLASVSHDSVYRGHLYEVKLPRWHAYPYVLIGDAAHAMMPATGMGSSAGIADAVALAEQLATQQSWLRAAANYESSRRTNSYLTQRVSHVVTDTMLSSGIVGSFNQKAAQLMPSSAVIRLFR